ncbi:heme/hemin ABC transporter substrate-binding protein [Methylovorus sp. SPW-M1]
MSIAHQPAMPSRREHLKQWLALGVLPAIGWLPQPAYAANRRLVCVGGALTEIVYALGASAELAGVDTTSLYPPAAQALPSVGYARTLSAEGILALAPSMVLATEDAGPSSVLRQLENAGIAVHILAANHQFEGLLQRIQKVGELTGRVAEASELQARLRNEWQGVRTSVEAHSAASPRVLFILSHSMSQIMVAGQETSADAMLRYAGARNAMQGFTGFKPLTPEAVIAAQPDIILLTDLGLKAAGSKAAILKLPGLAQTPAGRKQRIVSMETMLLLGFGPRLPLALKELDRSLQSAMQAG